MKEIAMLLGLTTILALALLLSSAALAAAGGGDRVDNFHHQAIA
jgi:hypothetical protein